MSSKTRASLDEHLDRSRRLELVERGRGRAMFQSKTGDGYDVLQDDSDLSGRGSRRRRPMSAKVRGQNDRPGKRRPRTARTRAESDDEEELSGIVVRRSQRRGGASLPAARRCQAANVGNYSATGGRFKRTKGEKKRPSHGLARIERAAQ